MTDKITIKSESLDQPEILALLAASDAHSAALYPPGSRQLSTLESLRQPEVTFLVARHNGKAVGCGAIAPTANYGEIKRMFVDPSMRGKGVGRMLLEAIEAIALKQGLKLLRLETGVKQPEASSLYRAEGFHFIGPFGTYQATPMSVFMEKRLK